MEQTYLSNTPNGAVQPGAGVMSPQPPIGRDHNKFDLSNSNYLTARYGEVTPFFYLDTVERDKVPFGSSHEIRSYTMTAPLMSRIRMCKDYFSVPLPAMLRRNWDIIYRTPKRGEDVPANTGLSIDFSKQGVGFAGMVKMNLSNMVEGLNARLSLSSTAGITSQHLMDFLRMHFFAESIFSAGSLLNVLGYHAHTCVRYVMDGVEKNYDDISEKIYASIKKVDIKLTIKTSQNTSKVYYYRGTEKHFNEEPLSIKINFHRMLDLLRDNITAAWVSVSDTDCTSVFTEFWNEYQVAVNSISDNKSPFNYECLIAYQAICSQFFTNDNVDNLYTFQLYEDNAYSFLRNNLSDSELTFTYNGVKKYYDTYSGAILLAVLGKIVGYGGNFVLGTPGKQYLAYLSSIFSFKKSLRYADYFNGARTSPLAVGDVSAPVVGNKVSAIDVTKNILMQRFLNAVAKVGSRFEEYARGIFGANPGPDYHEPKFVSHSVFNVGANEVDNTAENQGNIVQTLRSTGDKFEFELDFDIPSILMGVCYFDSPLVYTRNAERAFFKVDRYDRFNPMLQNIGDQPIYGQELNLARVDDDYFGYAPRFTEYKTRVSMASGGFVKMLPAWAFISDNDNSGIVSGSDDIVSIDSDFIRSNPAEFDRFYSSLTGSSLAGYFHFIIRFDNTCQPLRPMEYASTIL